MPVQRASLVASAASAPIQFRLMRRTRVASPRAPPSVQIMRCSYSIHSSKAARGTRTTEKAVDRVADRCRGGDALAIVPPAAPARRTAADFLPGADLGEAPERKRARGPEALLLPRIPTSIVHVLSSGRAPCGFTFRTSALPCRGFRRRIRGPRRPPKAVGSQKPTRAGAGERLALPVAYAEPITSDIAVADQVPRRTSVSAGWPCGRSAPGQLPSPFRRTCIREPVAERGRAHAGRAESLSVIARRNLRLCKPILLLTAIARRPGHRVHQSASTSGSGRPESMHVCHEYADVT